MKKERGHEKKQKKIVFHYCLVLALTVSNGCRIVERQKKVQPIVTQKKEEEVKKEEEKVPETTYPLTIKDQIGNEVTIRNSQNELFLDTIFLHQHALH